MPYFCTFRGIMPGFMAGSDYFSIECYRCTLLGQLCYCSGACTEIKQLLPYLINNNTLRIVILTKTKQKNVHE